MCNMVFWIDRVVSPDTYEDQNGYHHITYWGPNYFTVKGELDQLNDEYVINNVPLVDTIFDSNYWIWIARTSIEHNCRLNRNNTVIFKKNTLYY